MNDMVGVLGYGGEAGQHLISYLRNQYPIKCGQRVMTGTSQDSDIEFVQVDICDKIQLNEFCKGCRIIVNCAGPSYYLSRKVADVAYENHINYVDLFGIDIPKGRHIEKNNTTIIGAGSIPGLSGILPIWITGREKETIRRVDIFAGGNECITQSACIDFLMSTYQGFGKPETYYKDHKETKTEYQYAISPFILPRDIEMIEYLSEEMFLSAEKSKISELHWYNMQSDPLYKKVIRDAFWEISKSNDKSKIYDIARKVKERFMGNRTEIDCWYKIWIETETNNSKKSYGFCSSDSYKINARIAALCTEFLYEESYTPGIYWPFEVLNCEKVMEDLMASRILVEISADELSNCEEGVF